MLMIAMVLATNLSLSATLLRPGPAIATDPIWPDRAACESVRNAHLLQHPAPDHANIVVPSHHCQMIIFCLSTRSPGHWVFKMLARFRHAFRIGVGIHRGVENASRRFD